MRPSTTTGMSRTDPVCRHVSVLLVSTGVLLGVSCGGATSDPADGAGPGLSLVKMLGGADTAGYARAIEPRDFVFPDDHGPHPDFRTEWWYVTGNLRSDDDRSFGFQFTIFRSSLAPAPPGGPSAWATNQGWMGHFAVTDVSGRRFHAFERFARGGGGLAGATPNAFEVWLEDWRLASRGPVDRSATAPAGPGSASGAFPLRLAADGDGDGGGVDLELELESGKPVVAQGVEGLSRKGPEVGNASYYYSFTRMPATGRLVLAGDTVMVSGLAWLDREWSTSALSQGQVGWDWFALQLDDGWEVMVYQLRRADGSADTWSDGVLIDPAGERVPLEWGREIQVAATGSWPSSIDGAPYPSGWRIVVPERGWDLAVTPVVLDQELRLAFRYWEGAVAVSGTGEQGRPVQGRGYVELTGYAERNR